jgi:chaperonin GroES
MMAKKMKKPAKKQMKKSAAKKPNKKIKTKALPKKIAVKKPAKSVKAKTAPKKLLKNTAIISTEKSAVKSTQVSSKMPKLSSILSPLDDRILVQVEKLERKTAGGLFIPDTADVSGNRKAKVLAVGRGRLDKKGKIHPLEIKIGNLVLLPEQAGDEIEISGMKYKILRESDILGIVE